MAEVCPQCGNELPARVGPGRPRVYCSSVCRTNAARGAPGVHDRRLAEEHRLLGAQLAERMAGLGVTGGIDSYERHIRARAVRGALDDVEAHIGNLRDMLGAIGSRRA